LFVRVLFRRSALRSRKIVNRTGAWRKRLNDRSFIETRDSLVSTPTSAVARNRSGVNIDRRVEHVSVIIVRYPSVSATSSRPGRVLTTAWTLRFRVHHPVAGIIIRRRLNKLVGDLKAPLRSPKRIRNRARVIYWCTADGLRDRRFEMACSRRRLLSAACSERRLTEPDEYYEFNGLFMRSRFSFLPSELPK